MITIDLFSDPICPWCFVGKRRIESALAQRDDVEVEIHWHAFQLNPTMPAEGMERQEYFEAKFGNPDNAARLYDNIRSVGELAGIGFRFERILRTPNTIAAHRLIRFAAEKHLQDRLVERLFAGYFFDGEDIGETETLVRLASDAGLDPAEAAAYLASDRNAKKVRAEDMQARQLGIQGVPFFILNQQYAISGAQEPEAFHPLFDMLLAQEHERARATVI